MRAAAALLLVWSAAAAQEPAQPVAVVLLPSAIWDSMSAIWAKSNLNWNDLAAVNTVRPTHAYLGCMIGETAGDTLRVLHLAPAVGVRRRENSVKGDCSQVAGVIGVWHTHPYRPGFEGRAIKERGLSGLDLKTFAASGDRLAIVVWDADSLALAIRTPEGGVHYPAPYLIR